MQRRSVLLPEPDDYTDDLAALNRKVDVIQHLMVAELFLKVSDFKNAVSH